VYLLLHLLAFCDVDCCGATKRAGVFGVLCRYALQLNKITELSFLLSLISLIRRVSLFRVSLRCAVKMSWSSLMTKPENGC